MVKKKKYKLNPRPFFVAAVLIIIAIGGYYILTGGEEIQYFDFAACLAEVGATEYGFDACPNCATQKYIIGGEAFEEHIEGKGFYVKCRPESEANAPIGDRLDRISILEEYREQLSSDTTQGELCALMVGRGTPTWIINDQQISGYLTIPELAEVSGCPLPENFPDESIPEGDRVTEIV